MTSAPSLETYIASLRARLEDLAEAHAGIDSADYTDAGFPFERLALDLFSLQFAEVPAYRAFCLGRGKTPKNVASWTEIPAIPTSAFKELDVSSLSSAQRVKVFHSSGTTTQKRSVHAHSASSLELYEASLWPWFNRHLLAKPGSSPDRELAALALTPTPEHAPHSSLVHMFAFVLDRVDSPHSDFCGEVNHEGDWTVRWPDALRWLQARTKEGQPVLILGTAFSFVHLLDHLEANRSQVVLPLGSRVLETGGYKGRSRTLPKPDLYQWITRQLGVPPESIVCEYGMSELSSQAYDQVAGQRLDRGRVFHFPPWARFLVIDPETGGIAREGEPGFLQIFDLANARSVAAIQTEDLATRRGTAFELLGRSAKAEARGCSLMSGEFQPTAQGTR